MLMLALRAWTDQSRRYARHLFICMHVACHDCPRPDHGTIAYRDAFQDDSACADPYIGSNPDGAAHKRLLGHRDACLSAVVVVRDVAERTNQAIALDHNA